MTVCTVMPEAKIPAHRVYILVKADIQCLLFYSFQYFPNYSSERTNLIRKTGYLIYSS